MSSPIQNNITCRGCGRQQDFIVWNTLNVTLDPDRKGELVRGELTRFVCEKCGWAGDVVYPLLYHDMNQQLMIWLVPPAGKTETSKLPHGGMMRDYRLRLVNNRNELIEKILIFDAGLDDQVVECFKMVLRARSAQENRPLKGMLLFANVEEGAGQKRVICLEHLTQDGIGTLKVPFEIFERTRDLMADRLPSAAAERGQWLTVNSAYATALLDNSPKTG